MEGQSVTVDLGLLEIRLSSARRNVYIIGSIFVVVFLAFFMVGMLRSFGDREVFLVSAILVATGFSLVSALIKYEVAAALMDFGSRLSWDNKAE